MAYFPYSGFANEGRLRLQENASTRSVKADVTEGRLRNVEVIGAAERAASSTAATTSSEARHRLQEGTRLKNFHTPAVEIPRQAVQPQSAAMSVPNVRTANVPGKSDMSSSLRKPTNSNPSPSKPAPVKSPAAVENPFGGDDYDETKNPFADEEPANPFAEDGDDYNDELNPFAE